MQPPGGHTGPTWGAWEISRKRKKQNRKQMWQQHVAIKCANGGWLSAFYKAAPVANSSKSFSFKPFTLYYLTQPHTEDPHHRRALLQRTASQAAIMNSLFNSNTNIVSPLDCNHCCIMLQQLKAVYTGQDKVTNANPFVLRFSSSAISQKQNGL